MSELEPDDSRDITQSSTSAPGEPERTGARESETRKDKNSDALEQAKPTNTGQASYGNSGAPDPKG